MDLQLFGFLNPDPQNMQGAKYQPKKKSCSQILKKKRILQRSLSLNDSLSFSMKISGKKGRKIICKFFFILEDPDPYPFFSKVNLIK